MKRHLFIILFLSLFLLTGCLAGVPSITPPDDSGGNGDPGGHNPSHGSIAGIIYDAGFPDAKLQFGQVEIAGKVAPIKDGAYMVENIPNGIHTLKVTKLWYKTSEIQVHVSGSTIQDVAMVPDLTFSELDLFARIVYSEAKGESYTGQVAVAATILNRVLDPNYPNTISGVINEVVVIDGIRYYQYEPVKNGTINYPANQTAKNAVRNALAGWDPTNGATGFFAHAKVPQFSGGKIPWVWEQWYADPYKIRIGNHSFFR